MKPDLKTVKRAGLYLRWLPMIGSVALMVVVSLAAVCSFSEFKTADSWREHTYITLARAQTLVNDLFRIQQDSRNYVFTGRAAVLKTFQQSVDGASQQLSELKL